MADARRATQIALRFLVGLLAVLLVAEVAARAAAASGPPALRWYDASTQLKVAQMDALDEGAEVVFAGTSMVWQGFDPDTFTALDGRSAYNAGLAGGVPVVMEPWLLEQVVPRTSPDLVVWGLSSLDFSASYGADNLERYDDALQTRRGPLASVERGTASVSALVAYRTVLRDPAALFGNERNRIEDDFEDAEAILGAGGVRRDFRIDTSEERGATVGARVADFVLDPDDLAAIARTVAALEAQGIEVVFVEMPVPDRFVVLHPERLDDMERVHQATVALGETLGVEVIDLRSGYTDADFVDFTHLDASGSVQLTAALAAALGNELAGGGPEAGTILELSVLAGAVNDSAHRLLAALNPSASSEFWYGTVHYGHTRDLTIASEAGERRDVLFMGSSLMVNAAVPSTFTELDGRAAYNAAIPGTEPAMINEWTQLAVPLADPDLVVWGISPGFFRPNGTDPEACGPITEAWVTAADLRPRVFESVPGAAAFTESQRLFGDPATVDPPYISALHETYRRNFTEDGARTRWPRQTDEEKEAARDALAASMESYFVCQPRVEFYVETVRWLSQQGIDVVLVSMPISDLQASTFPGGREQIVEIMEPISQQGLAAGAALYLDLSDTLGDERFRDLRHLDEKGADRFTTRIANELSRSGL